MPDPFTNEYLPDSVSAPGETISEVLRDLGMSQVELAERMGRPKKTINEIINAKASITPETALQLERVLGVPASLWNNLERNYQEFLARAAETEQLSSHLDWPASFPIRQMVSLKWLEPSTDPTNQVRTLLAFFAVSSIQQWESRYQEQLVAFRLAKKFEPNIYALTAWLRQGERLAQNITCAPFDPTGLRKALQELRALTRESSPEVFVGRLQEFGSRHGVAIAFVPELKETRACGATRWLSPTKALVQLSLRYKTNDQLWFTFFHEIGHLLLHGKKTSFVEVMGSSSGSNEVEEEANQFAANLLIPRMELERFLKQGPLSEPAIVAFAERVGVAPGIVVGRLQHDEILKFNQGNGLKVRYRWASDAD